ncbi:MAG: primosomal protein N' [Acidobacteriota bacterium]|nr:primosomal protein N' [Acidobacteriota bacterium]
MTFTYRLPAGFRDEVKAGARVQVPFGKTTHTGYVVALQDELDPALGIEESAVKDVTELLDEEPMLTAEILKLTQWTADYYASSWGEILKASLPAGINASSERILTITEAGRDELQSNPGQPSTRIQILRRLAENGETSQRDIEKEFSAKPAARTIRELINKEFVSTYRRTVTSKVKPKLRKAVRLLPNGADGQKPLNPAQNKIIDSITANGGEMLFTELLKKADVGASAIGTLSKRGLIEVFVQEIFRDPLLNAALPEIDQLTLNSEQSFALGEIENSLDTGKFKAFLLHGITGSGKTEVYIRAMRTALDQGKSALMLVPEIALTPIFSRRLRVIFGNEVAILHSNLSPGERFDEWRRIRSGHARIVIGTRSAVFAPLQDLGLVIVDEEHDSSYRQNEAPFYSARDVAVMRANFADAVIVLGSATPALESFQNAQGGKYRYLQLQHRIGNRPLAKAELIDMRDVFRQAGKDVTLSPQLITAIEETHSKGEQSIILLNRRGFSQFVLCRTCGESLRCKNCDITLTFHRRDSRLVCHYCSHNVPVPHSCPFCKSEFLYFIGEGTEQLEVILEKKFPNLRIARIDRDTMARRGEMTKTLIGFDHGEIDMLVGTQMLAKGHDFHNVTLVGVISVDIGLGLPDFRSAERTFQLLTQVAGRAGRGNLQGRVLIQTYYPEHYALRHAVKQDFEGFFAEEIRYRQRLNYPPFVVLASILIKHADYNNALKSAEILKDCLDKANKDKACRILGVAPASLSRLKSQHRLQILIKSVSRRKMRETLDTALAEAEAAGCDMRIVHVEVDPVNLM